MSSHAVVEFARTLDIMSSLGRGPPVFDQVRPGLSPHRGDREVYTVDVDLEDLFASGTTQSVAARNVLFAHWLHAPEPGELSRMREACREWQVRLGSERTVLVNVLLDAGGRIQFPVSVRRELNEFFGDTTLFRLGTANVFEIRGLAGSAVRAVLNTAALVGRPVNPVLAFSSMSDAVPRLRQWLGYGTEPWTTDELYQAERTARSRFAALNAA